MLAPMEDVTDAAFRLLCKEFGADMVYTEFISCDALVRNVESTLQKLSISSEKERPVAMQIYGREPEPMAEAARMVERAGADVLVATAERALVLVTCNGRAFYPDTRTVAVFVA